MDPTLKLFVFGLLGGFLSELFGLFKLRHQAAADLPRWLGTFWYWFITVLMILAGGVLVIAYVESGIDLKPILAINVGASAPLIIGMLVAQVPQEIRVD